jgi:predicted TIM-barrel fold metal-dependent hydrolase
MSLFEIKPVDTEYYETRLRDFLPDRIIDMHTHVWKEGMKTPRVAGAKKRTVSWPGLVAKHNPVEDLVETYRLMFPGKTVTPLIFSTVGSRDSDFDLLNGYISESAQAHNFPALLFARPDWTAEQFEEKAVAGGFLGCKVYLSLSDPKIQKNDIAIFDFLPHHQLAVLDRHGWIAMLHIPRDGRLKDPVNLEQMLQIEERYPNVRLIVAHVGRAYCDSDVGDAFDVLAKTERMHFDISANTNANVFGRLIDTVGPRRILFGSDLPILRMRMRRIDAGGHYVNLVPRGLYGDVSDDINMGEVDGGEADRLTFFMYEEIAAFRQAAESRRLKTADIEDVFCNNAVRMLIGAGFEGL